GTTGTYNLAMARYNANGTLDTTFGTNGEVMIAGASGSLLVVQTDGKFILNESTGLVRYNANGTLDTTYGTGGELTLTHPPLANGYETLIQSGGKIDLVSYATDPTTGQPAVMVVQCNPDGTPDISFGTNGVVFTDGFQYRGAALQPDDKI